MNGIFFLFIFVPKTKARTVKEISFLIYFDHKSKHNNYHNIIDPVSYSTILESSSPTIIYRSRKNHTIQYII